MSRENRFRECPNGNLIVNGDVAPSGTIDRAINLSATGSNTTSGRIDNNNATAANAFVFNGAFTNAATSATKTFILGGSNTGNNVFQSTLSNGGNGGTVAFTKTGFGVWALAGNNTYTGNAVIESGTLTVSTIADSGSSNLGLGTTLRLGNANNTGTLNYTGSGSTTARQITIGIFVNTSGTGGGIITANGTNGGTGLKFTATNFNTTTGGGTASRTLTLGGANTDANEISGIIANTGPTLIQALTKADAGSWILSGNNSYTGITTVTAGTLQVNRATNGLGDSTAVNAVNLNGGTLSLRNDGAGNNGTVVYGSTSNATGYNLQLSNNSTINVANLTGNTGNTVQLGALTQATAAIRTLDVTGDNGYSLTLTSLGLNPAAGQTTTLNPTTASLIITGNVTNPMSGFGSGNFDTLVLGGTSAGNSIGGAISDAVGGSLVAGGTTRVTKSGSSTWALAGNNNYTGVTTVSGGVLRLDSANAMSGGIGSGVTTGSGLTVNGGIIGLNHGDFTRNLGTGQGQVQLTADNSGFAAYGADRTVNLGGASAGVTWGSGSFMTSGSNFVLSHATATHTVDFQNPVVLNGTRFFVVNDGAATVDGRLSGAITGSTTFSKGGAGTLELTNTGNAWTGTTFIDSGTLRLGAANVLPGTTIEIKRGATTDTNPILDLNGFSETIGGITLGISAATSTNNGQTPSIVNSGGGTPILTLGGDITYRSGVSGSFANGTATISANLATGNPTTRNILVGNGSSDNDLVISGAISGSGTIFKQGSGTLLLSGANVYTGQLSLEAGTVKLGASGVLPDAATNIVQLGINGSTAGVVLDINGFSETVGPLRINGASANNPGTAGLTHSIIDSTGGGVLTLGNTFNVYAGGANQYGQATIFAGLNPGAPDRNFFIENSTAAAVDLLVSGVISGAGNGFNMAGAGTLALSNANTFSGETRTGLGVILLQNNLALQNSALNGADVTTGTVSLDTGITTPTFGGLKGTRNLATVITSGYSSVTALTLNPNAGSVTYDGVIADGATGMNLSKTGAGTQVLTGTNTYTGTTTVSGGTLQVGNGGVGTTGTGAVSVQTASTILGSGTVRGSSFTAESGSTVHVGDSTGSSTFGTLTFTPASGTGTNTFQSGSQTFLGLNLATPGNSDKLVFTNNGSLTFDGNLTVGPATLVPTSQVIFQLLDWAAVGTTSFNSRYNSVGLLTGNNDEVAGLDLPNISGSGFFWDISNFTTNGSIVAVVPEPSRALLLLLGLVAVVTRRRRSAAGRLSQV